MVLLKIQFLSLLIVYSVFSVPQKLIKSYKNEGNNEVIPKTDNLFLKAILKRMNICLKVIVNEIENSKKRNGRIGYYTSELPYLTYESEIRYALL